MHLRRTRPFPCPAQHPRSRTRLISGIVSHRPPSGLLLRRCLRELARWMRMAWSNGKARRGPDAPEPAGIAHDDDAESAAPHPHRRPALLRRIPPCRPTSARKPEVHPSDRTDSRPHAIPVLSQHAALRIPGRLWRVTREHSEMAGVCLDPDHSARHSGILPEQPLPFRTLPLLPSYPRQYLGEAPDFAKLAGDVLMSL